MGMTGEGKEDLSGHDSSLVVWATQSWKKKKKKNNNKEAIASADKMLHDVFVLEFEIDPGLPRLHRLDHLWLC